MRILKYVSVCTQAGAQADTQHSLLASSIFCPKSDKSGHRLGTGQNRLLWQQWLLFAKCAPCVLCGAGTRYM